MTPNNAYLLMKAYAFKYNLEHHRFFFFLERGGGGVLYVIFSKCRETAMALVASYS